MAYDAEDTRARLLDAAFAEFVQYGLAGARVDRIARAANANKQAIYGYFGSKDALFDAVLTQRHGLLVSAVPLTPDDLPGYAAALYDFLLDNPGYLRLTQWQRLERPTVAPADVASYATKVDQIAQATPIEHGRWGHINLLLVILGIATRWSDTPVEICNLDSCGEQSAADRHRAAVIDATVAIVEHATRESPSASSTSPE